MNLTDLIPDTAQFTLSSTGKTYDLRNPNLEDRVEMVRLCGGSEQAVMEVFTQKKWDHICKIVYRLIVDKSDFMASKETIIDDDGIKKEVLITGPIRLLRAIKTQAEAIQVLGALTCSITSSEPLIKEYLQNEVKKNNLAQLIGEKSSTSSPVNMDTPQSNSENLPSAS